MKVLSPMPTGNGAYIVHRQLAAGLDDYTLCGYSPTWTLFPPALTGLCRPGRRRAAIIHTTPDHGGFFTRAATPLVLTAHNYMLDPFMQSYSSFLQGVHYRTDLKWFTHRSLARAAMVTSVSRFTAGLLREHAGYRGEIRVINNGIDADLFHPGRAGERQGKGFRVLFAGNLTRRKGADLLPEIARRLEPGITIQYTSGLRTSASLAGQPGLERLGSIAYADMPDLYRSVDALLFPTVREGFPLVALEAMACGLPVVASDCSSLPELVVDGQGGYLCEPGNAAAFAAGINRLAASTAQCRAMGEYNRDRVVARYRLQDMLRAYRELFAEVLDRA